MQYQQWSDPWSTLKTTAPSQTEVADEVARRTRQLQAIAELGQGALTGVDVSILVGQTCALVEFVLEPTRCSITELTPDGFVVRSALGEKSRFGSCDEAALEHRSLLQLAIGSELPVLFGGNAGGDVGDPVHLRERHGIAAGAAVRISGKDHHFGVLSVFVDRPRTFAADEQQFLKAVADLAGSMIDSARAREALESSEQRFRALVENSSDGILLLDDKGAIVYAGPSTARILGYAEEELVSSRFESLVHESDLPALMRMNDDLRNFPRTTSANEVRIRDAEGRWRWIESISQNMLAVPSVGAIVMNYRDVTERKEDEQALERLAYRDSLTGLPNRFLFHDRVHHALGQARRRRRGLALMYLDLDRFKLVNDTLGHAIGDRLLEMVATRLCRVLRSDDTIARLGGDEFAILLPDIDRAEDAGAVAQKVMTSLNEPFTVEGHHLYAPGSIGISLYPDDGEETEILLKNADSALYRAKELGRNNVQMFTSAMNDRYRHRLEIELTLRQALENHELDVHYQPIIDSKTGVVRSFEALLRWCHDGVNIQPSTFVPIAEETGLIVPIGEWVLDRVCSDLRCWRENGGTPFTVSVNLSPHQMRQPNLVLEVAAMLRRYGLAPSDLLLEVTESVALENIDSAMEVLGDFRAHGVRIAVDDFGTGQSSLAYLKRLPLDMVKLDREFLRNATAPTDLALLGSIIELVHVLNLYVVAEGIETEEELHLLQALGCDGMQGFLYSPAMPADQVLAFKPGNYRRMI